MTKICITVDVECSIGGAFRDPALLPVGEEPIWCNVEGRSEGLGFILRTLRSAGLCGSFFLETNHTHYFRSSPMRAAAALIQREGHDTQLHAHPCWSIFKSPEWRKRLASQGSPDNTGDMSVAAILEMVRHGLRMFEEWQLPLPVVFRSGNLQHNDNMYRALAQCGICASSSVGLGIFDSGQGKYQLSSGNHEIAGVTEMPVLSFNDRMNWRLPSMKCLTIAGSSFMEMQALLKQAEAQDIPLVVVMTHPFEFIQKNDDQFAVLRRHAINQQRFRAMCAFLKQNRQRLPCITMAQAAQEFKGHMTGQNTLLQTPFFASASRKVCNGAYDKYGSFLLRWS